MKYLVHHQESLNFFFKRCKFLPTESPRLLYKIFNSYVPKCQSDLSECPNYFLDNSQSSKIIVAEISSTRPLLSLLTFFFTPPSIIALWANTDVKRSS